MKEDDWGCILMPVLLVGGGIYAYNNYEIREINPAPKAIETLRRPTGLVRIATSDRDAVWYVDASTVLGERNKRIGWVTIDAKADKKANYRESKSLYRIDCDTTASQVLSTVNYNAKGEPVYFSQPEPKDVMVSYFAPGTMGASVSREICREVYNPPKKAVS